MTAALLVLARPPGVVAPRPVPGQSAALDSIPGGIMILDLPTHARQQEPGVRVAVRDHARPVRRDADPLSRRHVQPPEHTRKQKRPPGDAGKTQSSRADSTAGFQAGQAAAEENPAVDSRAVLRRRRRRRREDGEGRESTIGVGSRGRRAVRTPRASRVGNGSAFPVASAGISTMLT